MHHETIKDLLLTVSSFPHVQRRIEVWWGTKECRDYLKSLIVSDRENREGFHPDILRSLIKMLELHDSIFPKHIPPPDIWDME